MSARIRVAVLFGGRSAEHEVSILSAANVLEAIDLDRFDVVPIGISRSGKWFLLEGGDVSPLSVPAKGLEVALLPGGKGRLITASAAGRRTEIEPVDVVFPVLHGPFGEDGSVQGCAEIADVAYVGCGIFASAAAMDKVMAKTLLQAQGLAVAEAQALRRGEAVAKFEDLQRDLGPVLFIKPARQGSSVGVSRVGGNGADFATALESAFRHDDKVLVEAFVDGREIECSVLERADGSLVVSDPGEIVTAAHHDFYSYDAKYIDADGAVVKVPADVPEPVRAKARAMAEAAFRALGCEGMARVDLFLLPDDTLVVNELNTIPGFTNISMYAKALAASGISYRQLISELIDHALARHDRRNSQA